MNNRVLLLLALLPLFLSAAASDRTWNGGGGDAKWTSAANWGGTAPVAADALCFGGSSRVVNTNDLAADLPFAGITFNSGAGAFTLRGNRLTLGGGVTNFSTSSQTVSLDLALSGSRAFSASNGAITVSGVLGGAGGLTKFGPQTLTLTASNTYDGVTTVSNGLLAISHPNALGSTNGYTAVRSASGGYLQLSGGITVAEPLTLNGERPNSGVSLSNSGGSNTWSGAITRQGQIRIGSSGGTTLVITGGMTGSGGGLCVINSSGTVVFTGKPLSLGGDMFWTDSSGLTVVGVAGNTWGDTLVAGGTLRMEVASGLPAATALQIGVSYQPGGTVDLNGFDQTVGQLLNETTNAGIRVVTSAKPAVLTVNQDANTVYDGRLTGALSLVKTGAGTLTLSNALCTATGDITVSNGTLVAALASSLGNGTNVTVAGGMLELRSASVISNSASLFIASAGAQVTLGAGLVETVNKLFLGGEQQPKGLWGATGSGAVHIDDVHFAGTGLLQVLTSLQIPAVDARWDAEGTDTWVSTASNWTGDLLPPFDGTTNAIFGAAGNTATINTPVSFRGLVFNRDADFTLAAGAGALTLGAGGIAAALPGTASHSYTVAEDVTLAANQVWGVTNNGTGIATLTVSGTVGDGASSFGITKSGNGSLVLSGNNSYDGTTTVKTGGIIRISNANALGSTNGATVVESGAWLEVSGGIAVAEALTLSGDQASSYAGAMRSTGGSNTWSGAITQGSMTRIGVTIGSLDVTGGFSGSQGLAFSQNGGTTLRLSNKPFSMSSATLYAHGNGLLILNVTGNVWGTLEVAGGTVRIDRANALPAAATLQLSPNAVVDLNGNSQAVGQFKDASTTAGSRLVTSAAPATLTVTPSGTAVTNTYDGSLAGALSLVKSGTGILILAGANTLSGSVTVSNGTLRVAATSSLGLSTNIAVAGGTLELQTEHGIRDSASLSLTAGAKVSVAASLSEKVARLYLGGVPQSNGTWGASGSGADHIDNAYFSGGGRLLVSPAASGTATNFFIAPDGGVTNAGTRLSPFASLEQARDALRLAQQDGDLPAGGVTVWLRGGLYARTNTFDLTSVDSGTSAAPISYRAWPGETVRIHGAKLLPPEWFTPVTNGSPVWARLDAGARGHVLQADLAAHGITDFGTLRKRGFGSSSALAAAELFFDGAPQQLARWPDVGETGADATNGWAYTLKPTATTNFTYSGSRPARWGQAEELWFHGFWVELWADDHVKAASVNTNSRLVTLAMAPVYGVTNNMPYYAENLLEEITLPGEWYLNRSTGVLYFWPPAGPAGHETYLSMLEAPLVRLTGVEQVTLRDITFEMTRGDLLSVSGGDNNRVLHCTLRNAGDYAAKISGSRNGVSGCEIANPGDGGIVLSGGDRATLTGAGNYVRNCTVHGFSRWTWTYAAGVNASGVGQKVSHNLFYDAPHSAILPGSGNYNLYELNEIRDVCRWSSDAGAIYGGGDLGSYGTIVRNNFIHDIAGGFGTGWGTHGIYVDSCGSGFEVFGNICYQISHIGIQHNGGRDISMQNNVLVQCGMGLFTDAIGISWWVASGSNVWANLQALPYRGALWSNAFPQLAAVPTNWAAVVSGNWMAPQGSVFSRNIGTNDSVWIKNNNNATSYFQEVAYNLPDSDPLFVDEAHLDLTLRTNSPAFTIPGFLDIPFRQIGPETDALKELAVWDFPTAADFTGFSPEALVAPGALTVSGMTPVAAPGHPTWAVSVPHAEMNGTNEAGAVASGDCFEIALSPSAQQPFSLAALSFEHRKSGSEPGATLFVRTSADGYAATLGSATTAGSNVWNTCACTLSGVAALQNRTAPVTLRIYCYKPAGDPGTQRVSIDTISVKGAVQTGDGSSIATVFMIE